MPKPKKLGRKLAMKVASKAFKKISSKISSKALESGVGVIRVAADRAAETTHEATEKAAKRRLPIQRSIDVAVPLRVAWEEWEAFEAIPEGVHTVTDIERDGDTLFGQFNGAGSGEWEAEILDERDQQSFAWQSHEGSDCAGLVTFHRISDRLTRLELNLDVVPTNLGETIALATHRADRKADIDLRRFKARLELINPDLYEEEEPEQDEEPDEPDSSQEPEDDTDAAEAPEAEQDLEEDDEGDEDADDEADEDADDEADEGDEDADDEDADDEDVEEDDEDLDAADNDEDDFEEDEEPIEHEKAA